MKDNFVFNFSLFKNLDEETINTLTVLSNGYIAVRGDYEFAKSRFGTFVSGVYLFDQENEELIGKINKYELFETLKS